MFPPEIESTKYDGLRTQQALSWWHREIARRHAFAHIIIAFALAFAAVIYVTAGLSLHLAFAPLGGLLIAVRWRNSFDTPAWIYGTATFVGVFMVGIAWLRAS